MPYRQQQQQNGISYGFTVNFYAGGATTTLSIFYFGIYLLFCRLFLYSFFVQFQLLFGAHNFFFVLRSSSKLCVFTCNEAQNDEKQRNFVSNNGITSSYNTVHALIYVSRFSGTTFIIFFFTAIR